MTGSEGARPIAAVVLAGGESRRFGSDKLAADLEGRTVLDRALDGLPPEAAIAVVGPQRPIDRAAAFLREDPPGGGPAAGLVAGLTWATDRGAERILVLPGDAPGAGRAARLLLAALDAPGVTAAVGSDGSGREQVLQLALLPSAAYALIAAAGVDRGHGQSVRRLLARLTPAPQPVPLPEELTDDIDTVEQLRHFRNSNRT